MPLWTTSLAHHIHLWWMLSTFTTTSNATSIVEVYFSGSVFSNWINGTLAFQHGKYNAIAAKLASNYQVLEYPTFGHWTFSVKLVQIMFTWNGLIVAVFTFYYLFSTRFITAFYFKLNVQMTYNLFSSSVPFRFSFEKNRRFGLVLFVDQ